MGNKENIVNISESVLQGARYEYLFVAETMRRNLIPQQPLLAIPWDFTITHPQTLQSLRVQVKGTNSFPREGNRYQITAKTGSKKTEKLDANIVDVLSCYVEPYNCWYNIPTSALAGKSVWLYPHKPASPGQYEYWKHDWSVFET